MALLALLADVSLQTAVVLYHAGPMLRVETMERVRVMLGTMINKMEMDAHQL